MQLFTFFNSLKKEVVTYEPLNRDLINIYSCGPTVYDHSHIGHARSSITWDFIVRFLRFIGYNVTWSRNITDIDDKIINKGKETNTHPDKIARIYTNSYHEDMVALGIDWPDFEPRATEYLPEMFKLIEILLKKNTAYVIENDIYFSISSFKKYGELKGQPLDELEKGFGRIEPNQKKRHKLDFALWKGVKIPTEYAFDSPWGKGRPGWHLECSAMCNFIYKDSLDIHCGGDDLIFPHHENEIAQSISAHGKFARYWLHNGMIMVNGKKMSKSEGNFITIKEALERTTGNAIRFFVLNSHYRMPLNYTEEGIIAAQNGITRLKTALSDFETSNNSFEISLLDNYKNEFTEVLSNDFNSPQALSILFKLTDKINIEKISPEKIKLQKTLLYLSKVLGFNLLDEKQNTYFKSKSLSKMVNSLIAWRLECKKNKDFNSADKIRDILNECNIEIKDLSNSQYTWQIRI